MAAKGYPLGRVSDVRGLRIIVDTKEDCYRALRAVEVRAVRTARTLQLRCTRFCPGTCLAAPAAARPPASGSEPLSSSVAGAARMGDGCRHA
jgi:hypothetical protein